MAQILWQSALDCGFYLHCSVVGIDAERKKMQNPYCIALVNVKCFCIFKPSLIKMLHVLPTGSLFHNFKLI